MGREINKSIPQCFEIVQLEHTVSSYIAFNPHKSTEFKKATIRITCNLSKQMSIKGHSTLVGIAFVLKGKSTGNKEEKWKKVPL